MRRIKIGRNIIDFLFSQKKHWEFYNSKHENNSEKITNISLDLTIILFALSTVLAIVLFIAAVFMTRYQNYIAIPLKEEVPKKSPTNNESLLTKCDALAADADDVFLPSAINGQPQVIDPLTAVSACQGAIRLNDIPRYHYQLGRSAEALAKIQGAQGNTGAQKDNLNLAADEYQKAEEGKYAPAIRRIAESYYRNKKYEDAKKEFEAAKDGSYIAMCWIGGFLYEGWTIDGETLYVRDQKSGKELLIKSSIKNGKIPCLHPEINN